MLSVVVFDLQSDFLEHKLKSAKRPRPGARRATLLFNNRHDHNCLFGEGYSNCRFGEDVCKVGRGGNVFHLENTIGDGFTNKVVADTDVLATLVTNRIVC